tara:strand:- start:656 stop:1468 length:813 start_codon:yes stop_codon:yes gene_type:complete
MKNIDMFCLCLDNNLLDRVKRLKYIPVGLGQNEFSQEWLLDSTGENISHKNKFYGEYTFHFWFWKNMLNKIPDNHWIGFCAYRRFWTNQKIHTNNMNIYETALKKLPDEWNDYEAIIGDHAHLDYIKWIKVIKYGKIAFLRNPLVIFKNKRNIRFQFDLFHGNGVLDKAIELLSEKDRQDFKKFVFTNTSYNQGNMFICKSKEIINEYYKTIFKWLNDCEKIFGFNLDGYAKTRVYAFLAERFLPYWFNKYVKTLEWPIVFNDLNSDINK